MKRWFFLTALLFHISALTGEIRFSQTGENSSSYLFSSESDFTDFSSNFSLSPSLEWSGGAYEFKAEAELSYNLPEKETEITLNELYLTYYNYGIIKAQIGRFSYLPGSAEFLSNTNYLSNTDYIRFIESQGRDMTLPGDLFQLTLSASSLYLKGSFALTPVYTETLDASSPWLPTNLLNKNLYIYTVGLFERQDIYTRNPIWPELAIENISANYEIGYSSYWLDLSLQYYRGWDNIPLNRVRYEMKENNQFDLIIIPEYQKRTSIGINTTASWNSLHLWFDGSYTFDKKIGNRIYYIPDYKTSFTETPYLEGTAGLRYDFLWNDMSILLERKESRIFNAEEGIVIPYMNSAIAGALQLYLNDYRHRHGGVLLYHLEDGSWMGALQWQYNPWDSFTIEGTVGMLEGDEDSLFGHYEQDWLVSLNLTYRK